MSLRVTDLDHFSLHHVWRPFWGDYTRGDLPDRFSVTRFPVEPPKDLDETAQALADQDAWSDLVIGRLVHCGVTFPDWLQHLLVTVVRSRVAERAFNDGLPTDPDILRAEAVAATVAQACVTPVLDDDAEIRRLHGVIIRLVDLADAGKPVEDALPEASLALCRETRRTVHTISRQGGCDWELDDVLAALHRATRITWRYPDGPLAGHQLLVVDPHSFAGEPFLVSVRRPPVTPERVTS